MLNNRYVSRAFSTLHKYLNDNVVKGKVLAKETTMRVGGPAEIFAVADSLDQLIIVLITAKEWGLPLFVIGKGSNLLVSDNGFPGIVLRLGRDFMRKRVEAGKIQAGAAVSLPSLVQTAAKHSLVGLSFAVGIPGNLGGALRMNAGAHGKSIGDTVGNVVTYTRACELTVLKRDQIDFGYRNSSLSRDDIIVEATLVLVPGDPEVIKHEMEDYFSKRKNNQPLQLPNSGSIFKNPKAGSAGKLIEETGCKGMRIGGAEVSTKHANFIINCGYATASDVYHLMKAVQQRVFEARGILLVPEVELLGEFDKVLLTPTNDR